LGCGRRCVGSPSVSEPIWGVQSGDVTSESAVVWARSLRAGRMFVQWSTSPSFDRVITVNGPEVSADTHFIGKVGLHGLPSGTKIYYRTRFDGSPWIAGSFGTPASNARDVLVAWSGDTNGQGWGIDPSRGGMPAYATLLARMPDLFIHCGDT